jgi:integrase
MGSPGRKKKDYVMRGAPVAEAIANLPPDYSFRVDGQLIDFEPYKQSGDQSNDIAWGFAVVMWRRRNDISAKTARLHRVAIDRFFEHLMGEVGLFSLSSINQAVVDYFAYWMKHIAPKRLGDGELSETSRRKIWGVVRDYLNDLMRYGMIEQDIDLPTHVFDSSTGDQFEGYSQDEVRQIIAACRHDIRLVRRGGRVTTDHARTAYLARLIPHAIMVSLRTGINPEVLFDMEVTEHSLKPSHLLHSSRLILPVKRRSGHSMNVELTEEEVSGVRVKNNVVRLLEEVEQLTQPARDSLPENDPLKRKLWLVRPDEGQIDTFNNFSYARSIASFTRRHNIVDHAGELVAISLRRFRPTFAEAMLKISGGDIRDLQKRLGHANIRTTMGYLDPNLEERKEAFQYAGRAMVDWAFKGTGKPSLSDIAQELDVTLDSAEKLANGDFNMGAAKCKNPFDSPLKGIKKGELCTEYLACFRCGSCVVLKEDSHRLFSFYHWLASKKAVLGMEKWQATYGWVIDIIDNDIAPQLGDAEWIAQQKQKAKEDPFPMWPAANDADVINTEGLR